MVKSMLKGIVLTGVSKTRLYRITTGLSKQPLPDNLLSMSTLMLAGIREILVVSFAFGSVRV